MPEYKEDGEVGTPDVIYVDHQMKRCKKTSTSRRATYNKEYDLYVVDH